MKQSTIGVLLSVFVYPGLGQVILGSKYSGVGFISLTTIVIVGLVYRIAKRLYFTLDQMARLSGEGALELGQLIELLRASDNGWHVEIFGFILLLVCWIASILHAYLSGQKLNRDPISRS
ncbi:MAG: hypothetical protein GTN74_06565 [Proteobacteria bacterium]|nr:hypothetical protein [Pseudomonadota bacterium]NIS69252.1 hypothetical protein [Pseudomonadota bacterium]